MSKKGIGGWLLVFVIILILSVIESLYSILENLVYFNSSLYLSLWISHIVSIIFLIVFSILAIVALVNIFRKKKNAPKAVMIFLWVALAHTIWYYMAFLLFSFNALTRLGSFYIAWRFILLAINIAVIIVWMFYFKKSERVRNTFG